MSSSYIDPTSSSAYLPAETPQETRSIGEILTDVGQNVTTLLRQEVELAKAEAKQSASKAGKGIGMFAGAAVAGLMFLVFLSVAAWWALGTVIGNGWSGLIVAVVWAIIAGILAYVGKKELDKIRGLPDTAETVSQIPNAVKGHEERNQ
jgi:Putative Actinobacterial Holin-X, holin superfamily III